MQAKPAKLPEWATGVGAPITEPPAQSKANGWNEGIRPPHEWFNYWMNLVYQWINYEQKTVGAFSDLATAYTSMSNGDTALVWEDDAGSRGAQAIEKVTSTAPSDSQTTDIDVAGDLVVWAAGDTHPRGSLRDLVGMESAGTPPVLYTRAHTGAQVWCIRTNGTTTVIINGQYVQAFNATTGASLWEYDSGGGGTPADLCIVGNRIYVVGDLPGSVTAVALNITTGAVIWSFTHGAVLLHCSTDGERLFVAGNAGTGGAHLRALNAANGFDETGVSLGLDTSGVAWDRVLGGNLAGIGLMACDGTYLFIGYPSTETAQIQCIAAGDGQTVWAVAHPDPGMSCVALSCDQDYVYACMLKTSTTPDEGYVEARNKHTGALVWRWRPLGEADFTVGAAVSDGQAVFVVSASLARIWKVTRGNVPTRYRKVDPVTKYTRYRANPMQPEAQ